MPSNIWDMNTQKMGSDMLLDYETIRKCLDDADIMPKVEIIDYQNNYMNIPYSDEDEIKMSLILEKMRAGIFSPQTYQSLIGTSADPTRPGTPAEFLSKYPADSKYFRWECDSSILFPCATLIQDKDILRELDDFALNGVEVFIGRSRNIRNDEGDIVDPWGRSIHIYNDKFSVLGLKRIPKEIQSGYTKEILKWTIKTTVASSNVAIIVWEEAQVGYIRKKTVENFLNGLNPKNRLQNPIYSV